MRHLRIAKYTLWLLVVLGCFSCGVGAMSPSGGGSGEPLTVARDFLPRGETEKGGYGAYSYILFAKSPRNDDRAHALLKAYLELPFNYDYDPTGFNVPLNKRNVTYIPILEKPETSEMNSVEWVKENYDLERAVSILRANNLGGEGPFIVTHTSKLSSSQGPTDLAILDLSIAPEESMEAWLNYFVKASEEPDDWAGKGAMLVLLKIHDGLSLGGDVAEVVIESLPAGAKILKAFNLSG